MKNEKKIYYNYFFNKKKEIILLFSLIFFLFSFSCKTVQPEPEPEPEPEPPRVKTVVFKTNNDTRNSDTGYDWEIWIDNLSSGKFALNNIQKEDIYRGVPGSPQKLTYTLRSSQEGRVLVHFIFRRPTGSVFGGSGYQEIGRYIYTFEIENDLSIRLLNTEKNVLRGFTEDSLPVIEDPEIKN